MTDSTNLTPERRAELRQTLHYSGQPNFAVERDTITALLDAADERDQLAAVIERVQALAPVDVSDWDEDDPPVILVEDLHRALDGACPVCHMRGQHKMSCSEGGSGQLSLGAFRDSETGRFTFTGPATTPYTYTEGQEEKL